MSNELTSGKFLEYRRQQEASVINAIDGRRDPMMSMLSIELNTTELCNRTCSFCPRKDPAIYPNRKLHLSIETVTKVASDLAACGFKGRVSFSGFGEPVLNKEFPLLIRAARSYLPDNLIDTNTNGDKLTTEVVRSLFAAGISAIYVNLYDGPEQAAHFQRIFAESGVSPEQYKLRPHWPGAESSFGLVLNNRAGMVNAPEIGVVPLEEKRQHPCYYPFSRAMIDWNGNMLICTNDWGRKQVIGSVQKYSIAELWMSNEMRAIREALSNGSRVIEPCRTCDVDGTLTGKFGHDLLMEHYRREREADVATADVAAVS